ncbi:MAG: helix-turn-helix domain-containing protein [Lachnospiraceae bacterium]|jgi:transcriptional regulator with XRE-family HTH domain|nr:helix-turn-helix domain-containing protein [Lachnospiraceae bacterium]
MTLSEAISKRILNLCKERDITINKFSTMAGITQATVDHIIKQDRKNPRSLTILRIARGFGMDLTEFYNDKLFKNLDDD